MRKFILPLSLTCAIAACGSAGNVNSIDSMTTSSAYNGAYRKPINLRYPTQTRFLTSNGLAPIGGVGDLCLASGLRPASSMLCFSSTGNTEVQVRKFPFVGGPEKLQEIRNKMQNLQYSIAQLVTTELSTNDTAIDQATIAKKASEATTEAKALARQLNANNFFVYNWSGEKKGNADASVAELIKGQISAETTETGLVIVGGVTVSSLRLGLSDGAKEMLSNYPKATKIATYSIGADHLLYFSGTTLSAALGLTADGSLSNLKKLSPETKAAVGAYLALGRANETQGAFSAAATEFISLAEHQQEYSQQHILYSTMTDVETLLESMEK